MNESDTITITVKFFAGLRDFGPPKEVISIPKTYTLDDILERFKIPMVKKKVIVLINGVPQHDKNFMINNGDIIAIFPPIAGG